MSTLAPADLLAQLQWRYATKKFDPSRTIPPTVWSAVEQSLVLTPSSFGLQPWKFVVVTDPEIRRQLVPASWGQTQPVDCSHFVVLATRVGLTVSDVDRFLERTVEVRGGTVEALGGYRKVVLGFIEKATVQGWVDSWAQWQAYIALGSLMTSAAVLGVDACPMEGIEPGRYDEILGLPALGYRTRVACALGYRAADDKYAALPKVRFPAEDLILRR